MGSTMGIQFSDYVQCMAPSVHAAKCAQSKGERSIHPTPHEAKARKASPEREERHRMHALSESSIKRKALKLSQLERTTDLRRECVFAICVSSAILFLGHLLRAHPARQNMEAVKYFLFDFWEVEGDPRIGDYPLFRGGPWTAWAIIAFYVYFVKSLGPALMKNREAMNLRPIILAYNLFMIAVNAYFFYEIVVNYRFGSEMHMFDFERAPSNDYSPKTMHMVRLCFLFLLSKYMDLIETVFFVLRKKGNQISNLHVYHHSVVPILVHMFAKISPSGGPGTMFPFLNTFIHIIMYLYYSMAAMGLHKYLWWKKYLTQLQLGQFIIFGIYGGFFFYNQKGFPKVFNYLGICQPVIFFYMFYSFYRNSYNRRLAENARANGVKSQ